MTTGPSVTIPGTPVRVVDAFSEFRGKCGESRGRVLAGVVRVKLDGRPEGRYELFLEHALEVAPDNRGENV